MNSSHFGASQCIPKVSFQVNRYNQNRHFLDVKRMGKPDFIQGRFGFHLDLIKTYTISKAKKEDQCMTQTWNYYSQDRHDKHQRLNNGRFQRLPEKNVVASFSF